MHHHMTSKPGLVLDHPCSRKHQINYTCINEQLEVSPFAPQGEGSAAWAVALKYPNYSKIWEWLESKVPVLCHSGLAVAGDQL